MIDLRRVSIDPRRVSVEDLTLLWARFHEQSHGDEMARRLHLVSGELSTLQTRLAAIIERLEKESQ